MMSESGCLVTERLVLSAVEVSRSTGFKDLQD